MEGSKCRELVAETGRLLLEKGLVARTWGNISARIDGTRYAVSPSGLGYENMTAGDVPVYDLESDTWEGSRKPSSENKVHAAAYRNYPDVNFVIHTHQDYATAVGLVGSGGCEMAASDVSDAAACDSLIMTPEEREILGKVIVAKYGLPGSDELGKNVDDALKQGSKVILMKHHGVLLLGNDRDDTMNKAVVLERVCKRTVEEKLGNSQSGTASEASTEPASETIDENLSGTLKTRRDLLIFSTRDVLKAAELGGFKTQIDDMAQMLGESIGCVPDDNEAIMQALTKADAVLVKGTGCVIKTENADDSQALKLLIKKAATAKAYTLACGVSADLTKEDCQKMREIYVNHYSIQKEGGRN